MIFVKEPASTALFDEMFPLLTLHHLEVSHFKDMELSPCYDGFIRLEELGILRIFLFREELSQTLRGYNIFLVQPSIHYQKNIQAYQDSVFIHPEHRGEGSKFIRWCDEKLRDEGIKIIYQTTKAKKNHGKLLERMGYELMDLVYARRVS